MEREQAKPLLEMKCANPNCDNMIYVDGSKDMEIQAIVIRCGRCKIPSGYKEKVEKATYVKKNIAGQMKLDETLQKPEKEKKGKGQDDDDD